MESRPPSILRKNRTPIFLVSLCIALLMVIGAMYLPIKEKLHPPQVWQDDDEEYYPIYNLVIVDEEKSETKTEEAILKNIVPTNQPIREKIQPIRMAAIKEVELEKQADNNIPIRLPVWKGQIKGDSASGIKNGIHEVVEDMPEFPGGVKALYEHINSNIEYPEDYRREGMQGKVIVMFVVLENGSLDEVEVLVESSPKFNKEAVRVIKNLPKWKPGYQNDIAVKVRCALPVEFKISE